MKNILVFRNDRFGEFLLIIPALRALKDTFNAQITIVVDDYVEELARCIEYVDEVLCWRKEKHGLQRIWEFARQLKKKRFDVSVIFNPTQEAHFISYLTGIPIRVGYNRKWGFLLTDKMQDLKHLAEKHEVEYNLDLVGLIGSKVDDKSLSIKVPEDVEERVRTLLEKYNLKDKEFVVIHPFTSDAYKQWPIVNFYNLIKEIKDKVKVILIGGKEERRVEIFEPLVDGTNVIDLVGKTSLVQLGAILEKARVLVSNDSGPVHLACCVDTPCIVLFNNSNPAKSSKRWGPWGKGHIIIEKDGMDKITVDEVLDALSMRL